MSAFLGDPPRVRDGGAATDRRLMSGMMLPARCGLGLGTFCVVLFVSSAIKTPPE